MSSSQIQWSFIVPLFVVCFFGFSIQAQEQNQMNKKIEGQWQSLGLTCDTGGLDPDLSPISLAPTADLMDLMDSIVSFIERSYVYAQTTLNIQPDGSWDRQVDIGSIIPGAIMHYNILHNSPPIEGVHPIMMLSLLFNVKVSGDSCILREHGTYSWNKFNPHNVLFLHPKNFLTLKFESKNLELDESTCFQSFIQTLENNASAIMTPNQSQAFMQRITSNMNSPNFFEMVSQTPAYPIHQYEWMVDVSSKKIKLLHAYVEDAVQNLRLDTCSNQGSPNFIRYTKTK